MARGSVQSERTIAILSDDYLNAAFTQSEWAAAFALDPQGRKQNLIPVRVKECKPEGLLGAIPYVDLVGLSENDARKTLLAAFQDLTKSSGVPDFPGKNEHSRLAQPQFPRAIDKI
jgi:hypothetical protein